MIGKDNFILFGVSMFKCLNFVLFLGALNNAHGYNFFPELMFVDFLEDVIKFTLVVPYSDIMACCGSFSTKKSSLFA